MRILLKHLVNKILALFNLEIQRRKKSLGTSASFIKGYLGGDEIDQGERLGKELWDYLEVKWNCVGYHQMIAEKLCYPYLDNSSIVVEIGTGAGLLASKIIHRFPKITYYSLEPNKDLNKYLKKHFPKNLREVALSGFNLKGIDTSSIDFVLAYGVFTYLDTAAIILYCKDAVRVLREGGYLLFDIFDTDRILPSLINLIEKYSDRLDSRPYLYVRGVF